VGLWDRIREHPNTLGAVADLFVGLQTSADGIYVLPLESDIEEGATKPFLLTGKLKPYAPATPSARLVFPYDFVSSKAVAMAQEDIFQKYPKAWAYLLSHKQALAGRENGRMQHRCWYSYVYPKNLVKFAEEKLIIQVTAQRPTVLYDDIGLYMTGGGSGPFYGIRPKDGSVPILYLLGVLNSTLFGWMIKQQSTNLRGGYIKFSKQYIEKAPIPIPGTEEANRMVTLVTSMLTLHKQLASAVSEAQRTVLDRQIAATDAEINRLVYGLYGLTAEEITLVEAETKK